MALSRWLISIAVIALAALAGWFTAGEYKAPAASGDERLRERVLEFYTSGSRFDFESMMRLYTPAQQHADTEALRKKARRWKSMFEQDFDESHRADLTATAEAYAEAEIEIRIEGDWALATGRHDVFADGEKFRMDLEPSVWLRTGGDWWMYQLSDAELVAYGNPPEFARKLLFKREFKETTLDMDAEEARQQRDELMKKQLQEQSSPDDDQDGS